jgi:integrase
MVRVNLKGVHSTSKRLADGSSRRYWYAWKGGPRLLGAPGSPEFVASYHAAHSAQKQAPVGTLHAIIAAYRQSDEFATLADRTRKDYLRCIRSIEEEFASLPVAAIDDPRVNRIFIRWRNNLSCGARWADYHWSVLTAILSWSREACMSGWRRPEKVKKLYRGNRAEKIWLPEHIAAFRAACSDSLWLALVLALDTGQRQGDLLRLPWTAYNGETIRLRQRKTGMRVEIPVTIDLKHELASAPRVSTVILTNSKSLPWKEHGFSTMWRRASKAAGIADLTFNDLRGTAVTRLAEAGCTIPEIAAITGHSYKSANDIVERYLPRTRGLAVSAIAKLQKGKK